jgi:hypothetical protein
LCHDEFVAARAEGMRARKLGKKVKPVLGPISVEEKHSEVTAKYHSRCCKCRGAVKKGHRMVWRRGTRMTWHPRCFRVWWAERLTAAQN